MPPKAVATGVALAFLLAALPVTSAAPVALDAAPDATGWNSQRKVARDSQGRLYVAARVFDPELGIAVRVFLSADNGVTWSALPKVPDATSEMSRASLATDSLDHVHLTWTELAGSELQVFHATWLGSWTERTRVSFTPGYSGFPAIAVDRQNRVHVAWYGFDGTTYQVYYRVLAGNGIWGATETVSTGLQDANNPAIAIGPDDRPHIAWFLFSSGRFRVVYTSKDGAWTTPATLSDVANRALDPSLAVTSGGVVVAAWREVDLNGTTAVVVRMRTGASWGSRTVLNSFDADAGHPSVALDGHDRAHVFWDQQDAHVRYRVYNGTWDSTHMIPTEGVASFPSARWAWVANPLHLGANRIDVVWSEERGGTEAVGFGGVEVPATGGPPARSGEAFHILTAGAFILALLAAFLWHRWRRRRVGPNGRNP